MENFDKYFALYKSTDPPPVQTEGYKSIYNKYNPVLNLSDNIQRPIIKLNSEKQDLINNDVSEEIYPLQSISNVKDNKTDIVNTARQFIGSKYQWGGSSPNSGFDCSGLVQYVYKQNGIDLPRTVKDIEKVGKEIQLSDVQIGDLICTPGAGQSGKHIRIVSKIDNGQIYTIEAKGKKYGVVETPLTQNTKINTIRRVIDNGNYIIDYFVNKGLTLSQAKGIYGNIMQESKGDIKAQSGDGSYGLAQWRGDRKRQLFSMYGNSPTMEQQLDFIWWELNNTHREALLALKRSNTVPQSVKAFMDKFEKPHKDYANYNKRVKYAYG